MSPASLPPNSSTLSAALDGELTTADDVLAEMSTDFGHIVHARPQAVLRPKSIQDIATIVQRAGQLGIPVVARGTGHSTFGQAQAHDGITIDMTTLAGVGPVGRDSVTVEAGTTWQSVVAAAARHGLTPPVLTDYLGMSVGGTLCVGGIGGTSHRFGAQSDQVLAVQVVTGDGRVRTCSADTEQTLFDAVRAGHGWYGIVTDATIRLVPAPTRVRRFKLYYPTAAALTSDQRKLLRKNRFDHLRGEILPSDDGWRFMLDAAAFYDSTSNPPDDDLLAGLTDIRPAAEIQDTPYLDFAERLAPAEALLRATGEWTQPHPWWNAFLPDTATDTFVDTLVTELTGQHVGRSGLILVYPIFTAPLKTPLLRRPDSPVVFLVGILRTTPDDEGAVRAAIADNCRWYERARAVGGIGYQIGTVPLTTTDWIDHFGSAWPTLAAASRTYDPVGVFRSTLDKGLLAP